MRIQLKVVRYEDFEALEKEHPSITYRVYVLLRFLKSTGWSIPTQTIVDTGSPYSIIPHELAPALELRGLYRTRIGGMVPNEYISGSMVQAQCIATDETGIVSKPFEIRGIVPDRRGIPLILGIHGLLDRHRLVCEISERKAWIDL